MLRRRATAATDDINAVLSDESLVILRKAFRRELIDRLATFHHWQSGVWQNAYPTRRVLRNIADVLQHLFRPGRAIHADARNFGIHL
jgi:hypothetical protein